ncbi:hypothetical protein NQ318_002129 [Aromia moschata]|uniref:Mos1 transposase HTH domain-containing protein n=1 Tax=Aromia moschata TaxID=1265417 RepID=A0AAV8Y188_9CUCU|nr:hypothetical protein NQ318_002129 [Aromia moschata]
MLSVQMEQRVNLKFLVKLGKTFTEAYAMLKEVYRNECLSHTQVFEWFQRFKEGRRPKTSKTSTSKTDENIEKIVCAKMVPKLRIPEQTESRMNICADTVNNIDSDLGLLYTVTLKGTRFESGEAVKAKATEVLNQLDRSGLPALLSTMEKSYGAV